MVQRPQRSAIIRTDSLTDHQLESLDASRIIVLHTQHRSILLNTEDPSWYGVVIFHVYYLADCRIKVDYGTHSNPSAPWSSAHMCLAAWATASHRETVLWYPQYLRGAFVFAFCHVPASYRLFLLGKQPRLNVIHEPLCAILQFLSDMRRIFDELNIASNSLFEPTYHRQHASHIISGCPLTKYQNQT